MGILLPQEGEDGALSEIICTVDGQQTSSIEAGLKTRYAFTDYAWAELAYVLDCLTCEQDTRSWHVP